MSADGAYWGPLNSTGNLRARIYVGECRPSPPPPACPCLHTPPPAPTAAYCYHRSYCIVHKQLPDAAASHGPIAAHALRAARECEVGVRPCPLSLHRAACAIIGQHKQSQVRHKHSPYRYADASKRFLRYHLLYMQAYVILIISEEEYDSF